MYKKSNYIVSIYEIVTKLIVKYYLNFVSFSNQLWNIWYLKWLDRLAFEYSQFE